MDFDDLIFNAYDDAEHKAHKAYELYENGDVSQALLELDNAISINPANSSWHFNKALTLDSMGCFEEAIKEYKIALELNPSDVEMLNSLAVDYTRTGYYDLAIETFEQAQEIDPMFEPCYCNRIITYTEMEKHELAEQMFYLAQQIDQDCPICYYNIGNSLFIRGDYKRAISCWRKTAVLEKTHPQINYRIAQGYWADGDLESAKEHFLKELRTNPGDIDAIGDFGLLLLEMGQIDSAKEKFNRILEFEPDHGTALFYLGEIELNAGNLVKAENLFNSAMQKNNDLPGPQFRIAQCALKKGQFERTRYYLAAELLLKPTNPDVLVSMASMYLKMDRTDEAGRCLLMATDLNFDHPGAHLYLGICCAIRGKYEDAAEFFLHVLDTEKENSEALKNLAKAYILTGKTEQAGEIINRIKKTCPDEKLIRTLRQIKRDMNFTNTIKSVKKSVKSILMKQH